MLLNFFKGVKAQSVLYSTPRLNYRVNYLFLFLVVFSRISLHIASPLKTVQNARNLGSN